MVKGIGSAGGNGETSFGFWPRIKSANGDLAYLKGNFEHLLFDFKKICKHICMTMPPDEVFT